MCYDKKNSFMIRNISSIKLSNLLSIVIIWLRSFGYEGLGGWYFLCSIITPLSIFIFPSDTCFHFLHLRSWLNVLLCKTHFVNRNQNINICIIMQHLLRSHWELPTPSQENWVLSLFFDGASNCISIHSLSHTNNLEVSRHLAWP